MDWFKAKYWYDGANARFPTFEKALTLLKERFDTPTIIETGCQRQKEDLGAGMSTSIFAEYISRYGGSLVVVDNVQRHLDIARDCIKPWIDDINVGFHCSDSVGYLNKYEDDCGLLYLDSYDYPIGQMWEMFGGKKDLENAMKVVSSLTDEEVHEMFDDIIIPCQVHCLNEFKAIEDRLVDETVVLIDNNDFAGGGKPGLLKPYLTSKSWKCLIDSQQTLWIKE